VSTRTKKSRPRYPERGGDRSRLRRALVGHCGVGACPRRWLAKLDTFPGLGASSRSISPLRRLDVFWHRLNHRIPFLWRFHRTHHSDSRLDVTTASRFHVGEIVLSSILPIRVIALLGVQLWELAVYEGCHVHRCSTPSRQRCAARVGGPPFRGVYRNPIHAQGASFAMATRD
jgi:hypothetical protein